MRIPKVWNKRDPNCPLNAVYIGRPSRYGNPYHIGPDGNRVEVIQKYRDWIENMVSSGRRDLSELRGKDLVCWCKPLPCHGDVLVDMAN